MKQNRVYRLALVGLFAALSYVVFTFLQIKISLPGGDATSIHLGNAVVVLGALLLGGPLGGLAGAIGMSIGDLLDPIYMLSVPYTVILKLGCGLIAGGVAHGLGKINQQTDQKKIFGWALAAAIAGLAFNVVFDPLLGYYYKLLILGKPAADLTLVWNIGATSINAVISTVVSVLVYTLLRPALTKAGVMRQIWGDKFTA
ncbi:MAG: ECF transporter S component [Clostridiales bacterium]|nr:ECF transporter S component [Clostridiales bacterium]